MGNSTTRSRAAAARVPGTAATGVIDELTVHMKHLARAQARHAELMVEFTDIRRASWIRTSSTMCRHQGRRPQFRAGGFAATEISLAVKPPSSPSNAPCRWPAGSRPKHPDAWDAWVAGDIDQDKVVRINRALRRLVRDSSKELLNSVVVDLAVCRTPEILGRCLNQFIVRVEPDLQDERLHRSLEDRYVSVRPDLDGISFLSAAMSSVDAHAIDQVLRAVAAIAEPGDPRTLQQRRADALVDLLLGRLSNGCHPVWDTNSDTDDHLDDDHPGTTTRPRPRRRQPGLREPGHRSAGQRRRGRRTASGQKGAAATATTATTMSGRRSPGHRFDDWDLPASACRAPTRRNSPVTPPARAVHSG